MSSDKPPIAVPLHPRTRASLVGECPRPVAPVTGTGLFRCSAESMGLVMSMLREGPTIWISIGTVTFLIYIYIYTRGPNQSHENRRFSPTNKNPGFELGTMRVFGWMVGAPGKSYPSES